MQDAPGGDLGQTPHSTADADFATVQVVGAFYFMEARSRGRSPVVWDLIPAKAGITMALRMPHKGDENGVAPSHRRRSESKGRGWVPAYAGTTGGVWRGYFHGNDGIAA